MNPCFHLVFHYSYRFFYQRILGEKIIKVSTMGNPGCITRMNKIETTMFLNESGLGIILLKLQ